MVARRRRRAARFSRKKQNVEWSNNSIIAPVALTDATGIVELVPDGMSGGIIAADFVLKRIVGILSIFPQAASTVSGNVGFAIVRSVHGETGTPQTSVDPLSTDVDAGSQDILWQKQLLPNFGGQLTATALDFAIQIEIDIRGRPTLRKLDKRHGIQLVHAAEADNLLRFTMKLRILTALSR